MKNFNWEEFKRGNIAVHCDTKEKAKDFLKKCDKEGIRWRYHNERTITEGGDCWRVEKENTSYSCMGRFCTLGYSNYKTYRDKGLEIIKWEIDTMKELTFTEVMANIKEGQVWECTREDARLKKIHIEKGSINFIYKDGLGMEVFGVKETDTFILQRKEYTFQEAFKAYEEGKEIESVYSRCRYKKGKGKDTFMYLADWMEFDWMEFDSIELEEIRGKWYIND